MTAFRYPPMASQPQFAVQRPKGRGWKTLHSGPDRAAAERFFEAAKGQLPVIRLIEVAVEAADENATDYRWKLITLHDGRATWTGPTGGAKGKAGRSGAGRSAGTAARSGAGDGTRVPVRLYVVVLAVGLAIGAVVSLVLGLRQP